MSSGEGSDNINVVEKAKIYKSPKTEYEEAVNDAAVHIALQDPATLLDRGISTCSSGDIFGILHRIWICKEFSI